MTNVQRRYKALFSFIKRHWPKLLFLAVLLVLLCQKMFWAVLVLLCLVVCYKSVLYLIGKLRNGILRKILKGCFLFLFVFMISIGIKLFVADIYRIPSGSMENTLFPEDVIMVNKLVYGPKLPQSPFEISWVNLLFYLNDRARASIIKEQWWPYKRLKGSRAIEQGDVLVYQTSRTFFVVKRCVAVAGDTLVINKGEVYTNGEKYTSPSTVKNRYRLQVDNKRKIYRQMDSLGVRATVYPDNKVVGALKATLSNAEKDKLKTLTGVKALTRVLDTFDVKKKLFAMPENAQWTLDNIGPFIVPKKGMKIYLNKINYELYKKVLRKHEKVTFTKVDDDYHINGKKESDYTFRQDYYFVMGDNRKGSMDSRYFGVKPESIIVGRVQCVLFSNYQGEFQWGRFFKKMD